MEDTEVALIENDFQIFGVFDGHGGGDVSQTLARELSPTLLQALREARAANREGAFTTTRTRGMLIRKCIEKVFIDLDARLFGRQNLTAGSTAVVAVRSGAELYLANLGDSRAVLCQGGQVLYSTADHKPDNPSERARILRAGGHVQAGRVNGVLAVSRAFGDWDLKKTPDGRYAGPLAPVSSAPVVATVQLPKTPTVLLLACDGLWDVYSNKEVAQHLARAPGSCAALTRSAIHERNSQDNVTVMSVLLGPAQ
jgi:serine/threonine protein phosphatase PrpC